MDDVYGWRGGDVICHVARDRDGQRASTAWMRTLLQLFKRIPVLLYL